MREGERMKLKKMMSAFLILALLCGCTGSGNNEEKPEETAETVTPDLSREYRKLPKENHFQVIEKESLTNILSHGTAILFLGFPECPWCQAYIPILEEVLAENDALCDYYNIYAYKKSDREFYDSIAALIQEGNDTGEEIIQYDNDGLQVIYMPLVLFIEKGRITAFDNETCMEDSSVITPDKYWSSAKRSALKEKLDPYVKEIVQLQAENNSKGCDTGCKVGD